MKWYEIVGVILAYGALVKFIGWIFSSLKLDENFVDILPFIFSNIFAILIILIIIVVQLQKRRKLI